MPEQNREVSYDVPVTMGSAAQSVMETRITDAVDKPTKLASPQRSAGKRTKLQNLKAVAERLKRENAAKRDNKTIEGGTQK